MKHILSLLFLLVYVWSTPAMGADKKPVPKVINGVLDLSGWDFDANGNIALDGQWEIYWSQLLNPDDFKKAVPPVKTGYISVPDNWNNNIINGVSLQGKGYATYRLRIKLNKPYDILGIKLMDASSAYILWINGKKVASNGTVSSDPAKMKPQFVPLLKTFKADDGQLELVMQVSNNFHHKGGIWASLTMGTLEQLMKRRDTTFFYNYFLIGVFFILFIYHLWIYFFKKTEKAALWFGILCLNILAYTIVRIERFLYILIPNFNLYVGLRIEYLTMCLSPTLYAVYVYHFFPNEFSKKIHYLILGVTSIEVSIILFTPTGFYTSLVLLFQVLLLVKSVYFVYVVFKSNLNKRHGSLLFLISILIILTFAVNDILYARGLIDTGYIVPLGFFLVIITQAYILASRIAYNIGIIEDLSVELNQANIHLEQRVVERTNELTLEKKKSDDLLNNILPEEIADELKQTGSSEARQYDNVTVLFTDFVNFTGISETLTPKELVAEIDFGFKAIDEIIERNGLEKIKTIGDAYLAVSGLPNQDSQHAVKAVKAAVEIRDFIANQRNHGGKFDIRIGLNSGQLVAGIVGLKKFAYDIWGDTVNVASRIESNSETGKINISGFTYELVKDEFICHHRGKIAAKNKGMIDMYFVEGLKQV